MDLYPYQVEDILRMKQILVQHDTAFNFSDMRTGKLIEHITLCDAFWRDHCRSWQGAIGEPDFWPSFFLIVAPLSTLLNVRDEFERWLGWKVAVNPDWGPTTIKPGDTFEAGDAFDDQPVVAAVNVEKLRDPKHWVFAFKWDLVLFDEAHRYKSRKSQQTQGMLRLHRQSWRSVFATGTPLLNGLPAELYPLLNALDRKTYRSFWNYLKEYAADIPSPAGPYQDERAPWRKGAKDKMKKILAPYVVRRTYEEVRPDLPPVVNQTIKLNLAELDPDHWRAYQELEKEWVTMIDNEEIEASSKLSLTLRLRQLAASPANLGASSPGGKVKAIVEWAQDQPGKGIIWCWHRAMAAATRQAISEAAKERLVWVETVTGDDDLEARANTVQAFQLIGGIPAFLIATISSLKEGISLDTADWAVFAEKSWVPADNDQAAARILGPNQTGSPLVVSFVAEGTIEEHVERVLASKEKVVSEFMLLQELIQALTAHSDMGGEICKPY